MIKNKVFIFNPFSENTYLVWEEESKQAAIIDPGCLSADEENLLKKFVSDNRLVIKYLFNTHCHLDHIFGNNFVLKEYKPEYFIPELDKPLLENAPMQAKLFGMEMANVESSENFLNEQGLLFLGSDKVRFLFTPGHTPGEFCIYFPSASICFTGDVLFENSIGRSDLVGGDYQVLLTSIKEKLFTLPEETIIYPGHGNQSTIRKEKLSNPFFN